MHESLGSLLGLVCVNRLESDSRRNTRVNLLTVAPLPPTVPCLKRGNRASAGRAIVGSPLHWPALDYRQPLKGQP